MVIDNWPKCDDCGEGMPWIAASKIFNVHVCDGCGKLVLLNKTNGKLIWYNAAFSLQEMRERVKQLLGPRPSQREVLRNG